MTVPDPLPLRLAHAKWVITRADPFIGYLASEMPSIVVPADHPISTAATDYRRFYYNEAFCEKLTQPELTFVVIHEALHVLWAHGRRRGSRIPELFNIAADHAINLTIAASFGPKAQEKVRNLASMPMDRSTTPPEPIGCLNPAYSGLSAEEIYERLMEEIRNQNQDLHDVLKSIENGGKGLPGRLRKLLRSFDPDSGNVQAETDNRRHAESAIAQALARAVAYRSKFPGREPSDFERMALEGFTPQAKWDHLLRARFSTLGFQQHDWSRPHKKYLGVQVQGNPLFMPRLSGVSFGHIAVIIDTSGSISAEFLGQFIAEINGLLQLGHATVHLYTCDTEVHDLGTYDHRVPTELKLPGGGGTDFRPAFEVANSLHAQFELSALVYLTDTFGVFPEQAPAYPTIWLIPEDAGAASDTVPFGETIYVPLSPP